MTHLTDSEFIDWLEGGLPRERAAHVPSCAACRDQAEGLRAMMAETLAADAPEPSPLFWDQFPARVSEAIHRELPSSFTTARAARVWRPGVAFAALALALLLAGGAWWRTSTTVAPGLASDAYERMAVTATDLRGEMENDAEWAVVLSAAEGLAWEDAHANGLGVRPGSADKVALELTDDERVELARLLEDELKGNGA